MKYQNIATKNETRIYVSTELKQMFERPDDWKGIY